MRKLKSYTAGSALVGAMLLAAGSTALQAQAANSAAQVQNDAADIKSVTIKLPPQSLFSVIAFDYKQTKEAKEARALFQSSAIPMATEYGFARHGALLINGTSIGAYKPQGFLLTSWPNQSAYDQFASDPRWPEFSELRRSIWNDIRYYRDVQENGLSLTLRSDKFYTLAIAHTDPDNAADYDQYLANLEGEVERNGGRFVLKLINPNLESLSGANPPDQLTFIEWDDADGADRLLRSDVYKANRHLAASGTEELAFYRLRPSI